MLSRQSFSFAVAAFVFLAIPEAYAQEQQKAAPAVAEQDPAMEVEQPAVGVGETSSGTSAETAAYPASEPATIGGTPGEPSAETAPPAQSKPAAVGDSGKIGGRLPYQTGGLFDLGLAVALKTGGAVGKPINDLGAAWTAELEAGYMLPVLNRAIEVLVSGAYVGPRSSNTVASDPRLPGDGTWKYNLELQEAIVSVGVVYRILLSSTRFVPYVGAVGRMHMVKITATGGASEVKYGSNTEVTSPDYGGHLLAGVDVFMLGPGALVAELQVGYSPTNHFIRRKTSINTTNLALGYRLFL